jgi:putative SOS response-associated peptidase YedK
MTSLTTGLAQTFNAPVRFRPAPPTLQNKLQARPDGLFAFAGLWDRWKDPGGKVIESCTILTTQANALLKDMHSRMPVILSPDAYDLWLDPV